MVLCTTSCVKPERYVYWAYRLPRYWILTQNYEVNYEADEAYNKAIEKVVEPFVSSKVSAGQIRSQPMLTAALHGSQQFLQQQSFGHLRRDNKRQQTSPQGLRLTRDGRPVRCFRCEGNHYQSDCPLAAQTGEQQQQGGRAAASTSAPVGSAMPPPPGLPPQFTPPK